MNSHYDHPQFKYMFHIFIFIKLLFTNDCRTLEQVRNIFSKLSAASVLIRSINLQPNPVLFSCHYRLIHAATLFYSGILSCITCKIVWYYNKYWKVSELFKKPQTFLVYNYKYNCKFHVSLTIFPFTVCSILFLESLSAWAPFYKQGRYFWKEIGKKYLWK